MGEGDMGMALQRVSDDSDVRVSEEAISRINSARHRDVAFMIRQIAPNLSPDDVQLVAAIFVEAESKGLPLSKHLIEQGLLQNGRTPHKIDQLSRAIFK